MKHYRFNTSIIICAALIICAASCRSRPATRAQVVRYPVKYKIDGNFEDWKTYGIGQTAKELDWNSMVITPPHEGFIIKEFYFDNDDKYLYLFFKCKPTIAELYAKTGKTYSLDDIYIDSDLNPRTGCGDRDSLGYSVLPGADTKIEIPTHILFDWTDNVRGPYSLCLL
jgi:hypothetical protein